MGLAASQARLLMLTARKSDLELQLQMLNQSRMQLSNMVSSMFNQQTNLSPDSPDAQRIQAATSQIQEQDKRMEMMAKQIDTQHQAVQTEIEAVGKVINKNVESSFKIMG